MSLYDYVDDALLAPEWTHASMNGDGGWAKVGWTIRRGDLNLTLGAAYHRQGDFWLGHHAAGGSAYAELFPRMRCPGIGGGGTEAIFSATAKLGTAISRTDADQAFFPFMNRPLRRAPWVSRPMDENWGDMAMAVDRGGAVVLALIPGPDRDMYHGEAGFWRWFKPRETPPLIYSALGGLYKAIKKDNRTLGGFRGNHA